MVRALSTPRQASSYLDHFGMTQHPFALITRPSQFFESRHYAALTAHLASATQTADHLVVLCGASGSGKTTLLNRHISRLGDAAFFASLDDNCGSDVQFHKTILRQVGFEEISGTIDELRRITLEFLLSRGAANDPVLLIVDNAHLAGPAVLDQIRWMCGVNVSGKRVISLVLAGTPGLQRVLDSPAMHAMKFGNKVKFVIRAFDATETAAYVRHRLELAGAASRVSFADGALPAIHEYSGGVPCQINALCNAVLDAAHAESQQLISANRVAAVAESSQLSGQITDHVDQGHHRSDAQADGRLPVLMPAESILERGAPKPESKNGSGAGMHESEKPGVTTGKVSMVRGIDAAKLVAEVARLSGQVGRLIADAKKSQVATAKANARIAELENELAEARARIVAEDARRITAFEILRNGELEQVLCVPESPVRWMLGRGEDCDIRLDSDVVSRRHALIFCNEIGFYIEDLNSANGLLVNAKTVKRCDLAPDDTIMLGDFMIRPRAS